jgi:hypothetical protein
MCNRFRITDESKKSCDICRLKCSATSTVFDRRATNYAHFLGWYASRPGTYAFSGDNFIIYPNTVGFNGMHPTMCLNGLGIPLSWVNSGMSLAQYGIH